MSEIDIWIKLFEELGFNLIDEFRYRQSDMNMLTYETSESRFKFNVYFNYTTGKVIKSTTSSGVVIIGLENIIGNEYKDKIRNIKLEEILNN